MLSTTTLRLALLAALSGCNDTAVTETQTTTSTETTETSALPSCDSPRPILDVAGGATGLVRCEDGAINRLVSETSSTNIPGQTCSLAAVYDNCVVDDDCLDAPNGVCKQFSDNLDFGLEDWCSCRYSCADDGDCTANQACLKPSVAKGTRGSYGLCVPAECRVSSDCSSDECGLSVRTGDCDPPARFQCRSVYDECRTSADCEVVGEGTCAWSNNDQHYTCQSAGSCPLGRPLTVGEQYRTAGSQARGDWTADTTPTQPSRTMTARLAKHWLNNAEMEHASVASFARFTLELMTLGAPPELLLATQQAGADEVQHARLAYALASTYAGQRLGPGRLDLGDLQVATDPAHILARLIEEACVGETVSTALIREAALGVRDPTLRDVLTRIADDETRHAALAWQSLRWMLERFPELRPSMATHFAHATAKLTRAVEAPSEPALAFGFLGTDRSRDVVQAAILDVIEPCLAALRHRA